MTLDFSACPPPPLPQKVEKERKGPPEPKVKQ